MKNEECTGFLQWALPQLHLHWPGYREVRGQVAGGFIGVDMFLVISGFFTTRNIVLVIE